MLLIHISSSSQDSVLPIVPGGAGHELPLNAVSLTHLPKRNALDSLKVLCRYPYELFVYRTGHFLTPLPENTRRNPAVPSEHNRSVKLPDEIGESRLPLAKGNAITGV